MRHCAPLRPRRRSGGEDGTGSGERLPLPLWAWSALRPKPTRGGGEGRRRARGGMARQTAEGAALFRPTPPEQRAWNPYRNGVKGPLGPLRVQGRALALPIPASELRLRPLRQGPPIAEEGRADFAGQQDQIPLHAVEEMVQAVGHDGVHRPAHQAAAQFLHAFQRRHGAAQAPAAAQAAEEPLDLVHAERHAAREMRVGEQEAHHVGAGEAGRCHAAEGVIAGRGPQHPAPLGEFRHPQRLAAAGRHQQVVADVEQPGGLVGALDLPAELVEQPPLVAEERALGDAGMRLHPFLEAGA